MARPGGRAQDTPLSFVAFADMQGFAGSNIVSGLSLMEAIHFTSMQPDVACWHEADIDAWANVRYASKKQSLARCPLLTHL